MSKTLLLHTEVSEAGIDTSGAWLTYFQVRGSDVLCPRRVYTLSDGLEKLRGGSHVCFPNFGPGGQSSLVQHGFGRTSDWAVVRQADDAVELALSPQNSVYARVSVQLVYRLTSTDLSMELCVTNKGKSGVPIAPAFHPYFMADTGQSAVDGAMYRHDDLAEAAFLATDVRRLRTGSVDVTVRQRGLPQWVLWTDKLGPYVCLEPTAVGYGFVDGTAVMLAAGIQWKGALTIHANEEDV